MSKAVVPTGVDHPLGRQETNPLAFLQLEIERLFDGFSRNFSPFATVHSTVPRMDVSETDKTIEVAAELPGLEAKDIQLALADNVLTVRGEKKSEREEKQKDYRLVERSFGSFSRSLQLPEGVKAQDISAEIAKGVLKVTVKKPAPKQSKQIEIKTAA
jgi:HSP20 family protein